MARQALDQGDARAAVTLARGLLKADPDDDYALFILARALEAQGHNGAGRRAAARAFRATDHDPDRFMAAQIAARTAYADGRFGLAQYWLRRSMNPAPTDRLRQQVVEDFKRVRRQNPWNTQLRFTLQPSDNVNSGTENPYFIIDGLPYYGTHSPGAMALSGTVLRLEARTAYRLRQDAQSITSLTGQISTKRVRLSSAAKAAAPTLSGRDLSSTLAEIGLSHQRAVRGDAQANGVIALTAAVGQVWYGGDPSYGYGKLGLSRSLALSDTTRIRLHGQYERREDATARLARSDNFRVRGDITRDLANGAALSFGVLLDHTESDRGNTTATHKTAFVSYDFGARTGPVDMRVTLGARDTDFPNYFIGLIQVPGGRQDDAVFASLDITFTQVEYSGFVPRVSVIAQQSTSNISRFETSSTALSFGIESKF